MTTLKDSPHPHASLIFGFLKTNFELVIRRNEREETRHQPQENTPQMVLLPIHLTTDDRKKSFAVYQDTDSVLFDYFIKLSGAFHILKMV